MTPREAIQSVPLGRWAVGVSGGADSVALLALLRDRPDLALQVCHLNHETRGPDNDADAAFVADLAAQWNVPFTVARLHEFPVDDPNPSSRYRAARLAFFRRTIELRDLQGVILAHHADDQAETALLRLLRGTGPVGLGGIRPRAVVDGVTVLHPLLSVRRGDLREELHRRAIPWREDASNASPQYLRNRARAVFDESPQLTHVMIDLAAACDRYRAALDEAAPRLPPQFPVAALREVPAPLVRHAARRWLRDRGADGDDITPASLQRLCAMATDAATPPRQHFPGGLLVRRRGGEIFTEPPAPSSASSPAP